VPKPTYRVRTFALETIVGLWLVGLLIATGPNIIESATMRLALFLWVVPLGLMVRGPRFVVPTAFRQDGILSLLLVMFFLVAMPMAVAGANPSVSVPLLLLTAGGVWICGGLWELLEERGLVAPSVYSMVGTGTLLWTYFTIDWAGARFGAGRNPNSLGLLIVSLVAASYAIRYRTGRLFVLFAAGVLLLASGSRSALIGSLIVAGVMAIPWVKARSRRLQIWLLVLSAPMLVGALAVGPELLDSIAGVLAWDDPYRGIESGFTRRTLVWRESLALWQASPIFGVGFRAHEAFLSTASSAHNGYLALLAEVGIIGAALLGAVVAWRLRWLVKYHEAEWSQVAWIGLALLAGYGFIAFFERYFLNVGNPTSLLVIMFLVMPVQRRRGLR